MAALAKWLDAGRPLIVRRPVRAACGRICLGLPLPPDSPGRGKCRLAFLAEDADPTRITPPPALRDCLAATPQSWRNALEALDRDLRGLGITARVFGALAWESLTGLRYLTPESDVDIIIQRDEAAAPDRLTAALEAFAAHPGRPVLDVEIQLPDGGGFSFAEYVSGAAKILVKGPRHVSLYGRDALLGRVLETNACEG